MQIFSMTTIDNVSKQCMLKMMVISMNMEYVKCEHKTDGDHCIYFGENEYEGVGKNGDCGNTLFKMTCCLTVMMT